jgi:hypothetical protein
MSDSPLPPAPDQWKPFQRGNTKAKQTVNSPLVFALKRADESPAVGTSVTIIGADGAPIARARLNQSGEFTLPAGTPVPTAIRILGSSPGLDQVIAVDPASAGRIELHANVPAPNVTYFGQVTDPTGQPVAGVSVKLLRDGSTISVTTTDPNGAWVVSTPATQSSDALFQIQPAGKRQPVPVRPPTNDRSKLNGPLYIGLDQRPAATSGTTALSALFNVETSLRPEVQRLAPALFSRAIGATQQSPCSPYAPRDPQLRCFGTRESFCSHRPTLPTK